MRLLTTILLATAALASEGAESKSRSWRLAEIDAKISDLQRQLDYWQEKKRQLLDTPGSAPETKKRSEVHTGPRNGRYHYNSSGRKVYERK